MINTKAIKARLAWLGMSNKDLAEKLGKTPAHISGVINGKRVLTLGMALEMQEAMEIPDREFDWYFLSRSHG